ELRPYSFKRRALSENDVAIDIKYCGICHSDLHQINNDWGFGHYPMVPGHEIVGQVTQVGSKVKNFKVGDLVGVGCMVDSCRNCPDCQHGEEQFCEQMVQTYNGRDAILGDKTYGGFSKHIVVTEDFVLKIDSSL